MTQAARNANDGISLVQTAEGNLKEINTNLQRIRELAVQAANDTNNSDDRASIQTEINQRLDEINRIAESASFNGTKLLNGKDATGKDVETKSISFQVGAGTDEGQDVIKVDQNSLLNATLTGLKLKKPEAKPAQADETKAVDVKDAGAARDTIKAIDDALKTVDNARSNLGAVQNRFESTVNNLNSTINNLSASRSRIEDADYALEVSNMTRAQILQQAGTSVLAQANQVPQTVLSLLR